MLQPKRLSMAAIAIGLAFCGITALPQRADAWWAGGYGVGIALPPIVVAPPVYAAPTYPPPPPVYAPPVYAPPPVAYAAPRRVWVPAHWEGPYWVRGHWG
jgi:hypothetical protein